MAAATTTTTSTSATATTNAYRSALTRELLNVCLQYTTSDGCLATGGLGVWTLLQCRRNDEDGGADRPLLGARDAALEALRSLEEEGVVDVGPSSSLSMSLYTNPHIGCHAVLAAIHYRLLLLQSTQPQREQYRHQVKHHVQRVLTILHEQLRQQNSLRNVVDASVWTGMAGAMQTIFFLRQHTRDQYLGQELMVSITKQLLVQGRAAALDYQRRLSSTASMSPSPHFRSTVPTLLWKTTNNNNEQQPFEYDLGLPHGLVGILTTLLALTNDEWEAVETVASDFDLHADTFRNARPYIKQTIDVLPRVACHVVSGNLRTQLDNVLLEVDRNVSVAYGAPCHILLLLSAHAVFGRHAYLRQAQELAEEVVWARRVVWSKTSRGGLGLLHGITGNAYVLLQLSQALIDDDSGKVWKSRAERLARDAVQHWRELLAISSSTTSAMTIGNQFASTFAIMQAPYSLMGGLGGLVSLLMDLNHLHPPSRVPFPLFYQYPTPVAQKAVEACTPPKLAQERTVRPTHSAAVVSTKRRPEAKAVSPPSSPIKQKRRHHPMSSSSPDKALPRQPSTGNAQPPASPTKTPIASNKGGVVTMDHGEQEHHRAVFSNEDEEGEAQKATSQRTSPRATNKTTHHSALVLDEEDHQKALTWIETNSSDDEESEFILPRPDDVPNSHYLRMQMSFDENVFEDDDDDDEETRQHCNPQLLDEEDHKAGNKSHQWIQEQDDADEFQESASQDAPDERFLRMQETDSEVNTELFYARDGSLVNPSALDEEGHTISAVKQKNGLVRGHEVTGVSDFANARHDDEPDRKFLLLQDPDHEGNEQYYGPGFRLANPPLLDEEGHTASNVRSASLNLDEFDEFQAPARDEPPNEDFLRMQDSDDVMYYVNDVANNKKGLLDEEDLLKNNRRIIASAQEELDVEDFVESTLDDLPVEDYLRSQDSTDEMFFKYDVRENPPLLDEEEHHSPELTHRKQYSSEWSMSDEEFSEQDYNIESYRPPVPRMSSESSADFGILEDEEDGDEFEIPDVSDEPNIQFLRGNVSVDELSVEQMNGYHPESGALLDENGHQSINFDLLETSREQDEADEFGETDENEVADSRYLSRQDSANELYFDHYGDQERLLEAKKNVRLLAREAADVAMKATPKTPSTSKTPSKKKGRKSDFKKSSPIRGTPASNVTAATAATSLFSPTSKPVLLSTSYLDLANVCFKNMAGQGSLLNGGLGIAVYLRTKLSDMETDASKAKDYLNIALEYAKRAADDSKHNDGEKQYMSIISSDAVGSQCLLVSVLRRLGRDEEARKIAEDILEMIDRLYELDEKHDCSLLFGMSGALQAIWFLRSELGDHSLGRDLALTISSTILLEGLEHASKYETNSLLVWEWHERSFLGAGTGAVGILYALLGHTEEEWDSLNACLPRVFGVVRHCIDSLLEHLLESGNLKAAIDGFDEDKSTDWAHGAPGYCLLLLKAYEVFGDSKYLHQAKYTADRVIWPRRMQRKGLGLSRGVAGVSYVLLAIARVDTENSTVWRARALKMAQMAYADMEELQAMSKNPYSLFEGTGGLVSLLMDLECSTTSDIRFPFMEYPKSMIGPGNFESVASRGQDTQSRDNSSPRNVTKHPKKKQMSSETRQTSSSFPSSTPDHGAKFPPSTTKGRAASIARTATTAATTSIGTNKYRTPPRPTDNMAVSPLTEPSPGLSSSSAAYPLTEAKIRARRQQEKNDQRQRLADNRTQFSSKIYPPQVKRHIFTHPLKVPLAEQSTESWSAKQHIREQSADSMDSFDIFTRASIERRLRAEESWWKLNVKNKLQRRVHLGGQGVLPPVTRRKPVPKSSFRRLVGGFSPSSSSHNAVDESVDEKMAHVMEELSERLEDIETIM